MSAYRDSGQLRGDAPAPPPCLGRVPAPVPRLPARGRAAGRGSPGAGPAAARGAERRLVGPGRRGPAGPAAPV